MCLVGFVLSVPLAVPSGSLAWLPSPSPKSTAVRRAGGWNTRAPAHSPSGQFVNFVLGVLIPASGQTFNCSKCKLVALFVMKA